MDDRLQDGKGTASLEIGLSNCIFGERAPEERDFSCLRDNGIRQIEIGILNRRNERWDPARFRDVCRWIERYGMTVNSVHGPSGEPGNGQWLADPVADRRRAALAERREVLESARILGARYLIVEYECYTQWPYWPEGGQAVVRYEHSSEIWLESLKELLDDASRAGVGLAIENMFGPSCRELVRVIQGLDPDLVGVCFDSSHATYGREDFFDNLRCLAPRIVTTHLSDNDGLEEAAWQDRHWAPFQGAIEWERLVGVLLAAGYRGCFMLEVLNWENRITEALQGSITRMRELLVRK